VQEEELIGKQVLARLGHVIDPELGRSIVDLKMVTGVDVVLRDEESGFEMPVEARPNQKIYDVAIDLELTVAGCPLTQRILDEMTEAVTSYPGPNALLVPRINVTAMAPEKLQGLVADLKAARHRNPFSDPNSKTKIFAVVSGKGGVGKSSVTANLAATFAALGYDTAAIDADIYGFSLPGIFGVRSQPTNLDGMLMPVTRWGVKLMSIGMFAGTDKAILWRGPRLGRSLEQFLSDVWWGDPDVLLLDLAPGTGDMAISVAQALPDSELVVVTTPQKSASDIAARAGMIPAQMSHSGKVAGVVENMSWYDHDGEQLRIFGEGGGAQVAGKLTKELGYDVPLLAQLPLDTAVRVGSESGRPMVLREDGTLDSSDIAQLFVGIARQLMA
jgi:ATP-binding protein involved in chromosome partitioning